MRKITRAGILTLAFVFMFVFTAAAFVESAQGMPISARHKNENGKPFIDLNKNDMTLKKGKSETLKAVTRPSGQPASVIWTSSNPKIAKISASGKVTAVAPGIALITAIDATMKYIGTYDQTGYSAVCYVNVPGEAKDAKPLGTSDWTYYYGKTKLTAVTSNYSAAIANVKKSIGGYAYLVGFEGLGYYEGVILGSSDLKKAHTDIFFLSNEKGPVGYGYAAYEKSPIKTSRGIAIGTKKSVVQQQYGLPTFADVFTAEDGKDYELLSYHVKTAGKGFYTRMTFKLLKSKGTVTTINFYLGGDSQQ